MNKMAQKKDSLWSEVTRKKPVERHISRTDRLRNSVEVDSEIQRLVESEEKDRLGRLRHGMKFRSHLYFNDLWDKWDCYSEGDDWY